MIIEIIDSHENIRKLTALLLGIPEIGLVTCDDVTVVSSPSVEPSGDSAAHSS